MQVWQVQEAKMQLSKLIHEAKKDPQIITVRGEETVVVISKKQYEKLKKPQLSILEAMQKSPSKEVKLNFERNKDNKIREVEL